MNNSADVIFVGASNSDIFGFSVASAGDVNGDGYADAIIGAPWADVSGTDKGGAYLYFGSSSMDNVADVIFSGSSAGDSLGTSVASAGDVNGDGYADVIIGVPGADASGSNNGETYIYYGGTSMNNSADVVIYGIANADNLGMSVAEAGDTNKDGFADVIVGAYNAGTIHCGQAYVYQGGTSMNNIPDLTISGSASSETLGWCVSSCGDMNGDGFADVVVGATGANGGGTSKGQAYIFFGGLSMINEADITITGSADNDDLGRGVGNCGDVNGDGYTDVIIGAIYADAGGANRGQAYIYYGGSGANNIPDIIISGISDNDYLGVGAVSCGDVNGDGYSDVFVGAYYATGGFSTSGRAYIYYGAYNMNNGADIIFSGLAEGDYLGYSVN